VGISDRIDKDLVIQETIYGFVMALTFVTVTRLGIFQYDRNALIVAILAMDFVWGMIDLIIFFNMDILSFGRRHRTLLRMKSVDSYESRMDVADGLLDGSVFDDLDDDTRRKAAELVADAELNDGRKDSIYGTYFFNAVTAFVCTFVSALPSVFCLALIDDLMDACMAAAVVSSISFFIVGYLMADGNTHLRRILVGLALTALTMLLTLFAAYLGG